jgi:predicted AlkP superfamily pyrophosphatase or phosphodiesterase
MRSLRLLTLLAGASVFLGAQTPPPTHKLLVVSVDGLDWRYLRDRDRLGLRIPNLRRLLEEGYYARGVIGVWPSVTWPSHTTLITGVRPDQHRILGNRRPASEGGDYYWTVDLLHAPTLWQAVHDRGWKSGAVTWPVTAEASIDFNLPEFFLRRQGGSMDLQGVASKATPGLVDEISSAYPSFRQQWVDDRTRTEAVLYILRAKHPELVLVHLVDLDSEAHDQGPFEQNANAILERTDELIGEMLGALPQDYNFSLVSDHGFERVDKIANPRVLLAQSGATAEIQPLGGVVAARDATAAAFLRKAAGDSANGIGREIPHDEILQYAPQLSSAVTAFEPVEHVMFGQADKGQYFTTPPEKGDHGFWPARADYRSVFVLCGPGVSRGSGPEIQMTSIASRLAQVLGLLFPASQR